MTPVIFLTVEFDRLIADGRLWNAGDPDLSWVKNLHIERTAADVDVGVSH